MKDPQAMMDTAVDGVSEENAKKCIGINAFSIWFTGMRISSYKWFLKIKTFLRSNVYIDMQFYEFCSNNLNLENFLGEY